MDKDAVYIPRTRSERGLPPKSSHDSHRHFEQTSLWEDTPVALFLVLLFTLTLGWPTYFFTYATGAKKHGVSSHFNPNASIFKPHHFWQIVWSDVGILIALSAIGGSIYKCGLIEVGKYYLIPYLM